MRTYGIKFPFNDDPDKNRLFSMTQITKDALTSNLLLLLLTQKGERYYEPDYGTNLLKFIFEPGDGLIEADIEQEIKNTVSLYIPQLKIKKIIFNWNVDSSGLPIQENRLNVKINFTYSEDTFSENGQLELNF